jgi:hypothetical protein
MTGCSSTHSYHRIDKTRKMIEFSIAIYQVIVHLKAMAIRKTLSYKRFDTQSQPILIVFSIHYASESD